MHENAKTPKFGQYSNFEHIYLTPNKCAVYITATCHYHNCILDKAMTDDEIEEMYHKNDKGYLGCTQHQIENGAQSCSDYNMKRSICTNTCDAGYIL